MALRRFIGRKFRFIKHRFLKERVYLLFFCLFTSLFWSIFYFSYSKMNNEYYDAEDAKAIIESMDAVIPNAH